MTNTRLPRAERRQQLLDCAIDCFGSAGFHKTSMTDVAVAAGVTKPVLYQHFESKHDLFRQVLETIGAAMEKQFFAAVMQAPTPRERVEAGFRAYVGFALDKPDQFQLLVGDSSRGEEFAGEISRVEQLIAQQLATLIEVPELTAEDRLVLAHGIIGFAEGVGRHLLLAGEPVDHDQLTAVMTQMVWSGLRWT